MRNYRKAIERATALGAEFSNARSAAYRPNPDLTPEAQTRAVTERLSAAQSSFGPRFDALGEEARRERDAIIARAAKARPTLNPSDVAAMVRTEQAWSHNVRPALEQGRDLADALSLASIDEVVGAERFAAAWLATHARRDSTVDFRRVVGQAVAQAFARLAASPADEEAIMAGEAAHREFQVVQQVVDHHRAGRSLEAALAVQYADLPQTFDSADHGEGGEAA